MISKFLLVFLLISSFFARAQETYFSKTGVIDFFSSTPIEDIKAENNEVVSILNIKTGEISFGLLIKSFQFENKLMQEHFNENYMESDKFPKAKFEGKIINNKEIDYISIGTYDAQIKGKITIHGVIRKIEPTAKIIVKEDGISAASFIRLKPEDFQIEIPAVVRNNIAKIIDVNIKVKYELYNKD
jgi:hypothetical protein